MSLSFDLQDGTAIGLVGPTVFAIGSNDEYIVVKQHPSPDAFGVSFDRTVTKYYVVRRTRSAELSQRQAGVRRPLTEIEFLRLRTALHLPSFSKNFRDLE